MFGVLSLNSFNERIYNYILMLCLLSYLYVHNNVKFYYFCKGIKYIKLCYCMFVYKTEFFFGIIEEFINLYTILCSETKANSIVALHRNKNALIRVLIQQIQN